jgi:mannose-6-phosphate isomerase-like protein (cupin superfamily)
MALVEKLMMRPRARSRFAASVYDVLSGEGEVRSICETRHITAGMAAYLDDGAVVGIRQVGEAPLALIVSYPNPPATAA